MNLKLKKILTNTRVIILMIIILIGIFAINPKPFAKGAMITSVSKDSPLYIKGIEVSKEIILSINSKPVNDIDDYYDILLSIPSNRSIQIKTNRGFYNVLSGETPGDLGISVKNAPKTNLKLGLDLQGGTRVLLKPERLLSTEETDNLIENINQRLNAYGLRDMTIRSSKDLSGNQFILVEIAGANDEEVSELLSKQGKFEASIGNKTVFRGGDITYVCRTADCSGIDPNRACVQIEGGYACTFYFSISLNPEAAERQAAVTEQLSIVAGGGSQQYLNETLDLFLDDNLYDSLNIGSDLKGRAATQISISGPGYGPTQASAFDDALNNMKQLQTVLRTGSLPIKLDIVKMDTISPTLGHEFAKNALLMGLVSILIVAVIIFIKYRRLVLTIPILIITWLEVFLLFAAAALLGGVFNWQIDVPTIAGVIISIGGGVNDQIVITDEALKGGIKGEAHSWKKKLKMAFFIIFAAYFTTLAAMLPLLKAGAGLLRGFAITSLIGGFIGVVITRPVYAYIIEVLLRE